MVILERGQWWVSHELPLSPSSHEFEKKLNPDKGIREYLDSNDNPYRTWAYPDNVSGLSQFLNTLRVVDRRGLLDYRISSKVHTIAASGVGGGSLVYTNVTEKPEKSVLDFWDTQLNLGINDTSLSKYFEMALKATNTTRTSGQKLNLSNRLGAGYSTNGDLLGVINPTKTDIYATRGPIVTSAIKFDEGPESIYTIEDSSIPKMFSGISRLISQGPLFRQLLAFAGLGSIQTIINMITQNPPSIPVPNSNATLPIQISEQDLNNVLLLSGMGTSMGSK